MPLVEFLHPATTINRSDKAANTVLKNLKFLVDIKFSPLKIESFMENVNIIYGQVRIIAVSLGAEQSGAPSI